VHRPAAVGGALTEAAQSVPGAVVCEETWGARRVIRDLDEHRLRLAAHEHMNRRARCVDALVAGDAEPKKQLFSRRPDVTLANPERPSTRGFGSVEDALAAAADSMRDGERHQFERVPDYATPDLAYVHEIERTRARLGSSDDLAPIALRVTTIWRREAGEWRIAQTRRSDHT
jgi:ketosteroid isomerase-like protein